MTFEALTAPELTYSVVHPLVNKYAAIQEQNLSVVFCLLLNRVYFLRDENVATAPISRSRAEFCEILAARVFRQLGDDIYRLAVAAVTEWPVYNGADPAIMVQVQDDDLECHVGNAIELAILGKARKFIKSSACQKLINAIWSGKCVYQAQSSHSILSDTYKRNPIHFYDPHKAPLLDHYRLKVPAIRSVLDYTNFLVLFILFAINIESNRIDSINIPETLFMIYGLGFSLEKIAAMQEHGIGVFFKGTWNAFDVAFVALYTPYAVLRLYGVYHHERWARELGEHFLAIIASFMFPRLAFVTLKDNLMVLSLRAMFMQFMILMFIAAFCFCGFLYALWTLGRKHISVGEIAWWMLDLYFGLDASGFDHATDFHSVFGPILMVTYACLSNTLLLTVLVSILSNTFARINEDAAAESMFRRAVRTVEGVKADSLFSYQPPVNVLALCFMLPASYVLSPRWFHKVNVLMIRITNLPILLMISWYERYAKKAGTGSFYDTFVHAAEKLFDSLPRPLKRVSIFEGLAGPGADIDVIFEVDAYESALDMIDSNEVTHLQREATSRRRSSDSITPFKRLTRSALYHSGSPMSTHRLVPRIHLDTLVSGRPTQSASSPLAQMYPPVVDQIPEARMDSSDSFVNESARASRGVLRRRMIATRYPSVSSVQHSMPETTPATQLHQHFRSIIKEKLPADPEAGIDIDEPLGASVIEDESTSAGSVIISRRLSDMEKRQARIEVLLEQIVSKL